MDKSDQGFKTNDTFRHVMLFMVKEYTDPIDEVNWGSTTNPFEYIITQQFFDVSPNQNAATTLYTDFNITSSKIITADNITNMRSDLNLVTNNLDVMIYHVKDITSKISLLNSELALTIQKTKYLSSEVDKVNMKAKIGIALGVAGCVLGATRIRLAGKALSFAPKATGAVVKEGKELVTTMVSSGDMRVDVLSDVCGELTDEEPDIGFDKWFGDMVEVVVSRKARAIELSEQEKPDNIIAWFDKEYLPVTDINFCDELGDPSKMVMCKRFRHTKKPMIKTLAQNVNKITDVESSMDTKINEVINNNDVLLTKLMPIMKRFYSDLDRFN